jgi:TonB family protein
MPLPPVPRIVLPAPPSGNPNPGPPRERPPAPPNLDPNGMYIPPVFPDDVPPPADESWRDMFDSGSGKTGDRIGCGVPVPLVPGIDQAARVSGARNFPEALSQPVRPEPPSSRQAVPPKVLLSKLVRRVEPIYPEIARRTGIQDTVVLRVVVDESGRVAELQVMSGHPILAAAAKAAVEQWIYSPTSVGGRAISIVGVVSVSFTLDR